MITAAAKASHKVGNPSRWEIRLEQARKNRTYTSFVSIYIFPFWRSEYFIFLAHAICAVPSVLYWCVSRVADDMSSRLTRHVVCDLCAESYLMMLLWRRLPSRNKGPLAQFALPTPSLQMVRYSRYHIILIVSQAAEPPKRLDRQNACSRWVSIAPSLRLRRLLTDWLTYWPHIAVSWNGNLTTSRECKRSSSQRHKAELLFVTFENEHPSYRLQ